MTLPGVSRPGDSLTDSEIPEQAAQNVLRWLQTIPHIHNLYNLALSIDDPHDSFGHAVLNKLLEEVQKLFRHDQPIEQRPPAILESALFLDGEPRRIRADACELLLKNRDCPPRTLFIACGMCLVSNTSTRFNERTGG